MTDLFRLILGILASRFKARATLEAENRVLRQQVNVVAYRKSHPAILMVQSAQDRAADEIPGPLNAARDRGILVQ